ncbi:MAG: hypothetical protein SGPRY_006690, partial [Prymnesium sp.]
MAEDDMARRVEELEAMVAIFSEDEVEVSSDASHCTIRLSPRASLSVHLPHDYPSTTAPTPQLHIPSLPSLSTPPSPPHTGHATSIESLSAELVGMYIQGEEVLFQWAEHVRSVIDAQTSTAGSSPPLAPPEQSDSDAPNGSVFTPQSTRHGQRSRLFGPEAIDASNAVRIHHGELFHPPRSGPAENFQAHVAEVSSLAHVQWMLRELLQDKRIARATHNMFAYRFWDEQLGAQVADNDDDGEASSGQKLASLLDLMGVNGVMVVVSRWFGGTLLGPARFKHIANTARN